MTGPEFERTTAHLYRPPPSALPPSAEEIERLTRTLWRPEELSAADAALIAAALRLIPALRAEVERMDDAYNRCDSDRRKARREAERERDGSHAKSCRERGHDPLGTSKMLLPWENSE